MHRWERRLKDLSLALEACGANYFEPELFRFNANHFLSIARTVSFLFQKDKKLISDFDSWHAINVAEAWGNDEIMKWSISSRNAIEKEGDLDLHSQVHAVLISSYFEEQDISLALTKEDCLGIGIKRLVRFARQQMPSGVSDTAVIKIERTWVANTLPGCELLQALMYIYARMHEACSSLSNHIGSHLDSSIPHATTFDDLLTGNRGVWYVKLNTLGIGSMVAKQHNRDVSFQPPAWLSALADERKSKSFSTLEELVRFHAKMAEANFQNFGNHLAMLWLFNEGFEPIDFIATIPEDQASKYIFWRTVADRIHYLRAKSLIWVSEAWLRKGIDINGTKIIRNLPIVGEMLHVAGIDCSGSNCTVQWRIKREHTASRPSLEPVDSAESDFLKEAYYLIPAKRALEKMF